ncbi:GEVED domain-containing protein [Flavobacterium sp. GT3R68]|uniref:GEVED domain-containing protein n=1 Tax=Flavobacterium sp. GT3R68 TaxID=2594437 RepID=UPI000F876914|nr:GEVED domain-containing protein [Flavobacterium sp. GT3R68]RTY90243.1 hypothetical protein EKL32_21480 [Flavobacterium sp. GSN2]TRW90544.1 hypothetical protein FNW07_10985 [Flavobacterium sp. GT3R68]
MKQNYFSSAFDCKYFTKNSYKSIFLTFKGRKNSNNISKMWMLPALLMAFLFGNYSSAQTSTYTSSGTWVCPAGVTAIQVEAYGPGGGGGAGGSTNGYGGGGGGGGAYTKNTSVTVIPGTTYTITLGTPGAGGNPANGGNATATTATFGATTVTANGGFGGLSYTNGRTGGAGGSGGTFAGGTGGTGTAGSGSGGGGGAAGTTSNGGNGAVPTAGLKGTGGTIAGNGGAGTTANSAGGSSGLIYGGGGAGSTKSFTGAPGAGGYVVLTYTCPSSVAAAGPNQTLAACATTTTLAGNTPPYGSGLWTVQSGTATITSPTSPTSGVTGLVPGTTATLRWTISNGSCGSTISDVIITATAGPGCYTYCTAGGASAASTYISNVTLNTINQNNVAWGGYRDYYPTVSTNVMATTSYLISVTVYNGTTSQKNISAWIDWNNNGVFDIATETVLSTTSTVASAQSVTLTNTFSVPAGAVVNLTRLRVELAFNTEGAAAPCNIFSLTDVQDYKVNVIAPAACATPTAQPTVLVLTPASTTIAGSFTLASPAADNYLVLINTTGVAPAPVNGTTYSAGNVIGSSTVVDADGNNTFTATGLSSYTMYYIYVFSYNSACTGGPLYYTTSPLNGSTNTLAPTYCTSNYTTGTSYYIGNVTTAGINNSSTNAEGLPMFADYTAIIGNMVAGSSYTFNGTINTGSNAATVYVWLDWNKDGAFNNAEYPAGERYTMSGCGAGSANCPVSGTITVPAGALSGNTRMRVSLHRDADTATAGLACQTTAAYGETEGYTITVAAASPCTTPTAQPTALVLTPSGNSIAGTFTAASPVPNNYLVVISTVNSAPTLVNGTTYAVGNTIGSSTVVDIDGNTAFTASGLIQLTTYYVFIFSYNSLCTGGPLYYTTTPLNGSAATLGASYCTPTGTLNCTVNDYISNVTLNTLNNSSTCGAGGYTIYAATGTQTTTVTKGTSYNFSLSVGAGTGTHGAGVWIDFNQNGVFTDVGEFFLVSNTIAANSTTTISIPIPIGAIAGATKMRVRFAYNTSVSSTMSCTTAGTYGETEDYTITLANAAPCVTPTAQPTVLVLTPTSTSIGGSFTYASPTANNYLVIINTTNAVPVPVNGTTYAVGGTVGAGNTVVDIDGNNTFLASGLSSSTTYYIYVFSYNSLCTGGPLYYTTAPLNGTSATLAPSLYCTPSVTAGWESWSYISNVSFVGTLNDTSNNSTYTATPLGYQDYTGLPTKSTQAQGEGVNIFVQAKNTSFMKAWVDWNKDGTFADPGERVYTTGTVATYSTTFGFIIPGATAVGDYRVRIRTNSKDTTSPYDANSTSTFTPCGNINYGGETEDYLFTVVASCASLITSVTDGVTCGPGTVNLTVTGSAGVSSYKWYSALTGGTLIGTTASGTWTTPSLSSTTTYYVTAINGCESLVRTAVVANVNPVPTLNFSPTSPTICGENAVITLNASGDKQQTYLINENFETGGLGVFSNTNYISNGGAVDPLTIWQSRTSTFVPAQQVWFPAISSGFGTNKFVMSTSDVGPYITHNAIISPTVNSTNYLDLTLSFKAFYSRYYIDETALTLDYMTVDVSTNGGGAWTELARYTADIGIGTRFQELSFNLNAYINQPNLKVRIRYYGDWVDGIAIDDVKLYGYVPLNTAFSWTSDTPVNAFADFACTIPYSTAIPTVYIKPTLAQLETGSWNFTAIATLANGCSASQPITVTNNSKVWQTTASTDWNTASNWKPAGVPTSSNCVIIPNNTIISGSGYDAYAKNVTVKPTGILNLQPNNNLTVTDWVTVDAGGTFNIKNNASLVQINSVANNGIVNMERISQPMYMYDYTYWGSPHTTASGYTLGNLSSGSSYRYTWIPSVGGVSGNWTYLTAGTAMNAGKGFIVRAPDTYSSNPATKVNFTANFIGTPNNGDVATPITYGTMGAGATDDKWNLISNPYPCAVNATTFLGLASNVPLIDGTIYFWTHNSAPSAAYPDPFYGDFAINYTATDYASWNKLGGTGTQAITFGPTPSGYIAAGEAFFVKSLGVAGNATFNNTMRVTNNNSQFFRAANPTTTADSEGNNDIEKHRIWLNLTNNSGAFSQILVGYAQGATTGMDRDFDGTRFGGNAVTFYSILTEANLGIQGRPLPFNDMDQVTLGFNAAASGSYSVRIDHIDGLFDTQNIYLEDKLLNVIHDMKSAPYVFSTEAGNFNNRFVLRYTDNTLGTDVVDFDTTVKVTVTEKVTVHSSNQPIKNIVVFDLLGRKIDSYKNIDSTQFTLNHLYKTMNVLILKITLDNDVIVTQKISY